MEKSVKQYAPAGYNIFSSFKEYNDWYFANGFVFYSNYLGAKTKSTFLFISPRLLKTT
jgi:hypothetical protein